MPTHLDRTRARQCLEAFDLKTLFIEELGWDRGGADTEATVADRTFVLEAIAHKRGLVAYQYVADSDDAFLDYPTRRKIEKFVAKTVHEHIIAYASHDRNAQYWQWVKREPGRPDRLRQHIYHRGQSGEALIQRLEQIAFALDEEDDLTIIDVSGRVRAAFDVEKVTKKFYERFKKEHRAFLGFIKGIENMADREWYASLMLNRMMFIYFIQKRGFLDGDTDYLRNRLERVRQQQGGGKFISFYRLFLLRLFHEGLGQPEADRSPELAALLGRVPYLNGGLFDVHDLERDHPEIQIPDRAFEQIFAFFDAYQWHLDDRPLRDDKEINPDVLGYIFEKYINQKQMGAYYTKEDITGYISRNTIIPFLFNRAKKHCPIAFAPGGGVWRLLSDDPDKYFYEAVRHGITFDIQKKEDLEEKRELPPEIAAGLNDVSQRGGWNKVAPSEYALPTETWREHVARRQRYQDIRAKLAAGDVTSINDLITYNLDIEKFAQGVIAESEGPELVRAFWKVLDSVSILDPTCGSGAFLFAALNILEPIYTACLEAMQAFLDDLERSQRKHRPEKMSDFRKVLEQVREHASERYFILKSIMVSNLYGVDIMEEAVEICKLRLFLKLVAQLERCEQMEPLPDIDFNVRAGNTLVGFTTLNEIQEAFVTTPDGQRRMLYAEDKAKLKRIEEDAEIADRAFCKFREMQTEQEMDAAEFTSAKLELRKRLDDLRAELDRYLASEYDVKTKDQKAYGQWRGSHQPFHWFVEFYGIMHDGGFDVIIGNPPYVRYNDVRASYNVRGFRSESCGDLYAFCTERSVELLHLRGRLGLIVPISMFGTDGFRSLQELSLSMLSPMWVSSFANRPSQLFDGAQKRLTILLGCRFGGNSTTVFTARYLRWRREEFSDLFRSRIWYAPPHQNFCIFPASLEKLGSQLEVRAFSRLAKGERKLAEAASQYKQFRAFYTRKFGYFLAFLNFIPKIVYCETGRRVSPSELKDIGLSSSESVEAVVAVLSSSTFFWFWNVLSDCRNLNRRDLLAFPFHPGGVASPLRRKMADLGKRYLREIRATSRTMLKSGLRIETFDYAACKPVIDEIDRALAQHYGFTDEELDFIINYDIKYRMGREAVVSDV